MIDQKQLEENLNENETQFCDFAISDELKQGVKDAGYQTPTSFQKGVFDKFMSGKNLVSNGNSAYGKSLAFNLPILSKVNSKDEILQAIVVCENHKSAEQVVNELNSLGRHSKIRASKLADEESQENSDSHVLVATTDEFSELGSKLKNAKIHTAFFDELSRENALKTINELLPSLNNEVQFIICGGETYQAFNDEANQIISAAEFIENLDKPKVVLPAVHIVHQQSDTEPKPKALLSAIEFHKADKILIACESASECDFLARYLSRYCFKTEVVHEEQNRRGIGDAINRLIEAKTQILIAQCKVLNSQLLQNVPFMINYDMQERASSYEESTGFLKQAQGLVRKIVNIASSREMGLLGPIKAQCQIDFDVQELPNEEEVMSLSAARVGNELVKASEEIELGQFEPLASKLVASPNATKILALLLKKYNQTINESPVPQAKSSMSSHREGRSYDRDRGGRNGDRRERSQDRSREPRRHNDGPKIMGDEAIQNGEKSEFKPNNNVMPAVDGIVRLYVTLGRQDGFHDLAALAQYLSENSDVDLGHFSGSGMIRDNSAHIEVDEDVAMQIIEAINDSARPGSEEGEEGVQKIICERARQVSPRQNRRPQRRRPNYSRR